MKIFKYIFWFFWRVWFYVLLGFPIIIMLPFLLFSILSEKTYPLFFKLSKIWAKVILFGMGFYYKVSQAEKIQANTSYVFVSNHTSMTDIMLMIAISKNPFVFVGKVELAKIPLFGFFYKRTSILVDRSNAKSRHAVFESAQKRIKQGLSICIFPEGGVPDDRSIILDGFKDGAFRLAIEHQIPIVPITFADNKKRFSYDFFSGSPGIMRVKIHHVVNTSGKTEQDRKQIREEVRSIIYKQLLDFQKQ